MNILIGFGVFAAAVASSYLVISRMGSLQSRIEELELKEWERQRNGR